MSHKKVREIQSRNPNFYHPTWSLEHKNQGFVRQNFGHTKRAWIQEQYTSPSGDKMEPMRKGNSQMSGMLLNYFSSVQWRHITTNRKLKSPSIKPPSIKHQACHSHIFCVLWCCWRYFLRHMSSLAPHHAPQQTHILMESDNVSINSSDWPMSAGTGLVKRISTNTT